MLALRECWIEKPHLARDCMHVQWCIHEKEKKRDSRTIVYDSDKQHDTTQKRYFYIDIMTITIEIVSKS